GLAGLAPAPAGGAAGAADDGVQEVPGRSGATALPGGACRAAPGVSVLALEPVGGCPVPGCGGPAAAPVWLRPGQRCRGSDASIHAGAEPRKGDSYGGKSPEQIGHHQGGDSGAAPVLPQRLETPRSGGHACFGTSRRAVRGFTEQRVPREVIERVL